MENKNDNASSKRTSLSQSPIYYYTYSIYSAYEMYIKDTRIAYIKGLKDCYRMLT